MQKIPIFWGHQYEPEKGLYSLRRSATKLNDGKKKLLDAARFVENFRGSNLLQHQTVVVILFKSLLCDLEISRLIEVFRGVFN